MKLCYINKFAMACLTLSASIDAVELIIKNNFIKKIPIVSLYCISLIYTLKCAKCCHDISSTLKKSNPEILLPHQMSTL